MTELIASAKHVPVTRNNITREMVMVTTVSGAVVWVPKAQYDSSAEQINYKPLKAGEKYTNKDGSEGVRTKDGNEYIGCGKQIVQKHDSKSLLEFVISKGITPTFSLS